MDTPKKKSEEDDEGEVLVYAENGIRDVMGNVSSLLASNKRAEAPARDPRWIFTTYKSVFRVVTLKISNDPRSPGQWQEIEGPREPGQGSKNEVLISRSTRFPLCQTGLGLFRPDLLYLADRVGGHFEGLIYSISDCLESPRSNRPSTSGHANIPWSGTEARIIIVQQIIVIWEQISDSSDNAKSKREECVRFLDQIYTILHVIIALHVNSDTGGVLAPAILDHIGKFNETLQKIRVFVESQQEGNRLKQFLRQSETSSLLKDCNIGLQQTLDVFKIQTYSNLLGNIGDLQRNLDQRHEELLELIATLSEGSNSDRVSTINGSLVDFHDSSTSFSLLPGKPKIFHGRETELDLIVKALTTGGSARIAILGAGGMGKTSLAKAALHHPDITAKYKEQFFVPTDSVTSGSDLASLVGSHLGLKPGRNITKMIFDYFSKRPACLLILDNLETIWEPLESRRDVEDFLSFLTGVTQLALMITMRGAERPGKVQWTRPFLQPLKPLSDDAVRETFTDIAPGFHDPKDVEKLLGFTDNVPLAVDLLAHLVDYEGCPTVLARWETERTSMLSDGYDKRANLDISIALSLSSPRMLASPSAKELLSLLSILPDGLSETDLLQSRLPLIDILACRTTLLRTSLAYIDYDGHLKALTLIREHMAHFHPPSSAHIRRLLKHFYSLLEFYRNYMGFLSGAKVITHLASNLGNIQSVLLLEFVSADTELKEVVECTLYLNDFRRFTGRGFSHLMNHVPDALTKIQDPRVRTDFITHLLNSCASDMSFLTGKSEALIAEAKQHFPKFYDPRSEAKFYNAVGFFYLEHNKDPTAAKKFFETAISLSTSGSKPNEQCYALVQLSWIERAAANYSTALEYSREAQRIAKLSGNLLQEARALRVEGTFCYDLGFYKDGMKHCLKGMELLQLCGLTGSVVGFSLLNTMAGIHFAKSEYAESRSINAKIMRDTDPSQYSYAHGLLSQASIDVLIGADDQDVQRSIDTAYVSFCTTGQTYLLRHCDVVHAELSLRQENFVNAKTLFQSCYNAAYGAQFEVLDHCLDRLGDSTCWGPNKASWTLSWSFVFLAHGLKLRKKLQIHQALRCLGDVFLDQDDLETAMSIFTVALEGFDQMDVHRSKGDCLLRIGDIYSHKRNFTKATEFYRGALPLFERSLQAKGVSQINARLAAMEENTSEELEQHESGIQKRDTA
ncbi:hypothetical protein FB451DRAFT_1439838 [Mycena latifolia]|nr:hypothetical protein FB451DRAFT_1439838 [Mycena latifolia]